MTKHPVLKSEEDVRSKVVLSWLASHGFTSADIQVEQSFELRVGHNVWRVGPKEKKAGGVLHPRTDVLVRHVDGRNLLVVEVKAPGEPLDDEAREQGLSYARLCRGAIAPFVVLTDGDRARIFDSITGAEIDGEAVPKDHPHARGGFCVTGEHSDLRAEALERLVSLNPGNLAEFCRAQVDVRMRKLRDTDPRSGRKYIPELYVERREAQRRLDGLIAEGRRVVLVVGPPQVGKTNLVCHSVERRLEQGEPTLFYPAIAVGGLAAELHDDFEWTLGQGIGSKALAAGRLARVARAAGRRLVIFVDGWNEAAVDAARSIDAAAARIVSADVTFVISMTNVAARRLLTDEVGDPAFVADEAGISLADMALLSLHNPTIPRGWSVVMLAAYGDGERKEAYQRYAEVFGVTVPPNHRQTPDPLLLRIAMLAASGGTLPRDLDEAGLLEAQLRARIDRARVAPRTGRLLVTAAAEELLEQGAPAREDRLLARWGLPLSTGVPAGLFDAALLAERADRAGRDGIDFYYHRERDYVAAYWARDWPRLLNDPGARLAELERSAGTEVGRAALEWFLGEDCNRGLLEQLYLAHASTAAAPVRRLLMERSRYLILGSDAALNLVEPRIRAGLRDEEPAVRLHALEALEDLVSQFWQDDDEYARLLSDDTIIEDVLRLDSVHPFRVDEAGEQVLRALRRMHGMTAGSLDEELHRESPLTRVLAEKGAEGTLREAALKAFAYVSPLPFFRWLAPRHPLAGVETRVVDHAVENAVERIRELLYWEFDREGGWADVLVAGGWLDDVSEARVERARFHEIFRADLEPVIRAFPGSVHAQTLEAFLADLATDAAERADLYQPGTLAFQSRVPLSTSLPHDEAAAPESGDMMEGGSRGFDVPWSD